MLKINDNNCINDFSSRRFESHLIILVMQIFYSATFIDNTNGIEKGNDKTTRLNPRLFLSCRFKVLDDNVRGMYSASFSCRYERVKKGITDHMKQDCISISSQAVSKSQMI